MVNVPTPGLLGVVSEDHQDEFVKMFETVEWFITAATRAFDEQSRTAGC